MTDTIAVKSDAVTTLGNLVIDTVGGNDVATSKITLGAANTNDGFVSSSNPLPISDAGGSLTVDNGGTFAVQATLQAGSAAVGKLAANSGVTIGAVEIASAQTLAAVTAITNVVHVDDNSGSLTVDGTVTANLGTLNGAATAAKQPALGTAGTASSDVLTVQGIASMTALKVDNSAVTQPISASALPLPSNAAKETGGNLAALAGTVGTVASAAPTTGVIVQGSDGTNARNVATTTGGVVKVDLSATAGNSTAIKVDNSAVTQPANVSQFSGHSVSTGSGTTDSGTLRVTLASDSTGQITITSGAAITANAGTNLNTSALALETGGNLATAATNTTGLNNTVGTAGSAIPTKGLVVQGSDGTNARALATTTGGVLKVDLSGTASNSTAVKVDASSVAVPITDNSGSLTVDAPVGTPVFVRLSDGSSAISTLPVSAASLPLPTGAAAESGGNLASIATNTTNIPNVVGTAGSAIPTKGLIVQGSDGTNARAVATTTAGIVKVDLSGTASNSTAIKVDLSGTSANSTAVKVDGSAVTQPVSNGGTFAVQSTLQAGTAYAGKVRLTDGTNDSNVISLSSNNALAVAIVDGSGNQVTSFAGTGGTSMTDAATFTRGSTAITPIAGVAETSAPSLTTGKAATLSLNTSGGLRADISQVAGANVATGHGTASGALRVELPTDSTGVIGATQSGTWTVQPGNTPNTTPWLANPSDPAATTGSISVNDSGTSSASNSLGQTAVTGSATASSSVSCAINGQQAVGIQISGTVSATVVFEFSDDGGTTYWAWPVEERDNIYVTSITVSDNNPYILVGHPRGATNVRVRCTSLSSGTMSVRLAPHYCSTQNSVRQGAAGTSPWQTVGSVASGSADSGNPLKIGAKVSTSLSGLSLASDANRTDLRGSEDGVIYTRSIPAHPADYFDASPTTITSSTSDTSIQAAAGSGVRNYMTGIVVANSSATATRVTIKDGSGGTSKAVLPVPASNSGVVIKFDPPLRSSTNTAFFAACADSVASVYITPLGYKSKV